MAQPLERKIVGRARALIAAPQMWTQGEFARDGLGQPVCWRSPQATQFCIWGALNRAADELTGNEHLRVRLADGAARALRGTIPSISRLNDSGTHAEVLALIDSYLATSAT
ncbi:MAG: hypothetical protein J2P51_10285 [Hyphomicrobiaceae bacterium]|nr:hypothetical protein [Hyphomicrobiaceae bacterium]